MESTHREPFARNSASFNMAILTAADRGRTERENRTLNTRLVPQDLNALIHGGMNYGIRAT